MGRRAIIFHGTGAEPGWIWYPWLADRLRARGYDVETPHHPGTNVEPIAEFLPRMLATHTFSEDTVLVGHSGGAALLLAVLERLDVTVAQAVLVAGYSTLIRRSRSVAGQPRAGESVDHSSCCQKKAHVGSNCCGHAVVGYGADAL